MECSPGGREPLALGLNLAKNHECLDQLQGLGRGGLYQLVKDLDAGSGAPAGVIPRTLRQYFRFQSERLRAPLSVSPSLLLPFPFGPDN